MDLEKFIERDVPECYFSMAVIMGAVNYYTLYETWAGEPEVDGVRKHNIDNLPVVRPILNELNSIAEALYGLEEFDAEALKGRLTELRENIKSRAMEIASYTDVFSLYEYVLNRISFDTTDAKTFNNDASARDILSAIFGNNENAVINENIRLMVSQLPLRMTKAKFFSIIEDSLRRYIDTDSSSLEREIYMIKSSAGLFTAFDECYTELNKSVEIFKSVDFSSLDENSYKDLETRLADSVSIITDISEFLQAAEAAVNMMLITAVTYVYIDEERKSDIAGMKLLTDEALEGFKSGVKEEMSEATLNCLELLEGKFESMMEKIQSVQTKISKVYKDNSELETPAVLKDLEICERLVSLSVYADLEDAVSTILTEDAVLAAVKDLQSDMAEAFSNDKKTMVRARMAAALAQLPVFFESRTDVMNYVRDSLDGCRDINEKRISVKLLLEALK